MKLEMTLTERPSFLYAVPIVNLFALLQLFTLLGPSLLLHSGVTVELPESRFQMERYEESIIITLTTASETPTIYLGRDAVTAEELSTKLDELRATTSMSKSIVLLRTDRKTPVGIEREITELVLKKGFRLALVGKT